MSVPAKRKNRAKTKRGRSHNALAKKSLIKCSKCGKPCLPHKVCPACGYYQGKEIIKPKIKKSNKNK